MFLILTAVAAAPTESKHFAPNTGPAPPVSNRLTGDLPPPANLVQPSPAELPKNLVELAPRVLPTAQPRLEPEDENSLQSLQPEQPEFLKPLDSLEEIFLLDRLDLPSPVATDEALAQPDAVEVFEANFEDDEDIDLDGWPDGWSRKRAPGYPWYLRIGLDRTAPRDGEHALSIRLNGGAAAVYSPPIAVHGEFSYLLQASIKTVGLQHDCATVSVTFYDAAGDVVERFTSEPVSHTTDWRQIELGPLAAQSDQVRQAVIGLHVQPGSKADLHGKVYFDNVWLGRLPRMSFSADRSHNVYALGEQPELNCKVSGIFDAQPVVVLELFDIEGNAILTQTERLAAKIVLDDDDVEEPSGSAETGFCCEVKWLPAITRPGFYRAVATLQGQTGTLLKREQTMAFIAPGKGSPRGEFGWTLPSGTDPLSLSSLEKLLPNMGVNWVKLPLWAGESDHTQLDRLVTFAERMSQRGIETVGLLTEPPESARAQFGNLERLSAADIFSTDPKLWYPLLEPVMARLSLQVRWWQLGNDDDVSFVGYRKLLSTLARVRAELQRFGQEVHLGMGWRIFDEPIVATDRVSWDFISISSNPQPTAAEIAAYLPQFESDRVQRWISLKPLPAENYSLATRAGDLVHRMLAAKMAGAEAIFLDDPFHPQRGLMRTHGTPGELLLPWRTTSQFLSGASYLGSIRLPRGSRNHLFTRDGEVVMVVWNDRSVEETVHLGTELTAIDLWGRPTPLQCDEGGCRAKVGPLPIFIRGVHPAIVRWNLATSFQRDALPSIFGASHDNGLMVTNTFSQGVGVKAQFHFPESWKVVPRLLDFKLAMGEEAQQYFGVALPYDASSGKHQVRIDFDVQAEQRYQFSVFREMNVGNDEILIDATAQLNELGELEVEQIVINRELKPVSFKCFLFVPDRRRLMTQVIQLSADQDRKLYRLPNGRELIGQTLWLRAEEIGGNRTLNRQLTVVE